jgi:hypothetical protein
MAFFGSVECCCAADKIAQVSDTCHAIEEQHCHPASDNHSDHDSTLEETCCETGVIAFFHSVDLTVSSEQALPTLIFFVALFNPSYFVYITDFKDNFISYKHPLLWSDLSIRFQTFLI